ncbi:hypothetical protein TSC_c22530 [Thermus scotoductus SA-01]|uniref:Uncharacterized protein n=1 Tax=Thermus scotoductus (strain ATCC 700910 / SA-01) TaxID=743525 RepID=E8PPK7_THESS|nr:hypothetical protein TSC_c22530 [Thermus scotoductus SA-01]
MGEISSWYRPLFSSSSSGHPPHKTPLSLSIARERGKELRLSLGYSKTPR